MKARCLNSKNPRFDRYGGRGITVCERWFSFENFYADMGPRPAGTTLDRIDNNGNYEPNNCQWLAAAEQSQKTARIRNLTFNGRTLSVAGWARHLGIKPHVISMRLNAYKWPIERALSKGGAL